MQLLFSILVFAAVWLGVPIVKMRKTRVQGGDKQLHDKMLNEHPRATYFHLLQAAVYLSVENPPGALDLELRALLTRATVNDAPVAKAPVD